MEKTVSIIRGGPVGLAAAAHAMDRNMKPIVLEAGQVDGHAVGQWSHVRMFSPWEYSVDSAAAGFLQASSCCGGPASRGTDPCCVADTEAKIAGEEGCGCAS